MWMMAAVGAGGAVGSIVRHLVGKAVLTLWPGAFPVGTLLINVAGSFLMGLLVGIFAHFWNPPAEIRTFLTVGLLGGFTTFSTFSLDVLTLAERGEILSAMLYVIASVLFSLLAIFSALGLMRSFA